MKIRRKRQASPDGLYDFYGPIANQYAGFGVQAVITGRYKEGIAFNKGQVDRYAVGFSWAVATEQGFMNIIEQLKDNYEEAARLWEDYDKRLTTFRSSVKNDVTSLEAAARKTTEAVQKMLAAYGSVIERLSSVEMRQATENAERLAAAMSALANLQSHKLSIEVEEQKGAA